ncbi:energy transducer TonB [Rheinheimera sp. 1928-s]|uniref:energy transducer TonB n=1 Tax=Rheinheimera sp. 1928-s TaxID=3033803 RepID=UPI00262D10DD|nr:energy transducer TonB [Rheinheimera sp. 1928-s]MDF3126435.1 TonB family protein [Rheinheimera sp. 1928-s]
MKRSALLFIFVLMVHVSLVAAAVTLSTEPQAKAVETAIEGLIIPAPVTPQPEKPEPSPALSKPVKKPKPKPLQQKPAVAKKNVSQPKAAQSKPTPVAEASPTAISAPEPVAEAVPAKTVTENPEPEAEPPATPPVASASNAVNKAPIYPMLSRRLKEQGTVYLQVLVLKNGKVGQLKLKQSSGFARLDQSALNAVRNWTYEPALKLGQPIDFWFVQPVVFNLNSIH